MKAVNHLKLRIKVLDSNRHCAPAGSRTYKSIKRHSNVSDTSIQGEFCKKNGVEESYASFFKVSTSWYEWMEQSEKFPTAYTRHNAEFTQSAVLDAYLVGQPPWEISRRLEYLKRRRQTWGQIFSMVMQQHAETTLNSLQYCNEKGNWALSEKMPQGRFITELRQELTSLQNELSAAHDRMHETEARVELNVRRIDDLKRESAKLESTGVLLRDPEDKSKATSSSTNMSRNDSMSPTVSTTKVSASRTRVAKKNRGLESSLNLEPQLHEFWYPVEFSKTLESNTLVPLELFDEPWVLFRGKNGRPSCIRDWCAHRACPLSLGKLEDGEISCAYHGWKFAGDGECTAMPSTVFIKGIGVDALPCIEADAFIWVYPGQKNPPEQVPTNITEAPHGFDIHSELLLEVPVEHGLLIENLLDLAHAPFTHTSTFAKGWPVPDLVAFKTVEMLGGHWHPYPIDMSFAPPCMTLSTIGLSQPGKIERGQRQEDCRNHLHQLHVCLPAGKGRTRLLYRMSLDFISWAKGLPFMDRLWKRVADQVLNEDLRLVLGQQENLIREGPQVTWANPVPYDKLAVRYRRWRNNLGQNKVVKRDHSQRMDDQELISMSAGELFSEDRQEL